MSFLPFNHSSLIGKCIKYKNDLKIVLKIDLNERLAFTKPSF